ncbi:hypothetical protein M3Y14_34510 (plasmid) [Bacillus thuringiensis]|uniref:hypothetical protein n=1 Tax=Bacillus thuringiensis TaxID=1428 RepID=UPI0022247A8D|nr:hypothetical protein [Bacillus thuringiensis]UYX56097.1 hypothetical protein M3Y14_34510 [Bacillus thuringiensis]
MKSLSYHAKSTIYFSIVLVLSTIFAFLSKPFNYWYTIYFIIIAVISLIGLISNIYTQVKLALTSHTNIVDDEKEEK